MRAFTLLYGLLCYAVFFATFVYAVLWIGNLGVPNALDSDPTQPTLLAGLVNLALLSLFAIQHSVMARPFFKEAVKRWLPHHVERSTYVLASSLALILMFVFWQPMGGNVWTVTDPMLVTALYAMYFGGCTLVLISTFMISHADLFGVRQAWSYFRGRPYEPLKFRIPGLYKYVRHPLYVGWLISFWATPTMTSGHFMFAVVTTVYILIAVRLEERDLEEHHGMAYRQYKNEVPMLIPSFSKLPDGSGVSSAT